MTVPLLAQPSFSETFANPSGFGADNGLNFISGSYQNKISNGTWSDGEATIGHGFGSAEKSVGLELSYTVYSFGRSQGIGSGAFNAKIHKLVDKDTSLSVGYNGFLPVRFEGGKNIPFDYQAGGYVTVSKYLYDNLAVTAGVGTGDLYNKGFASVAYNLSPEFTAIGEWTGNDATASISYRPKGLPFSIVPGVRDLTTKPRFVLGANYEF